MKVFKILLPVLILGVGAGSYYYFKTNRDKPKSAPAVVKLPTVSAQVIAKGLASPSLTLFGQVEAPNNSVLSAGVATDVLEVFVLEGSAVSAGDTLIRLDDADIALEILQRKAELADIEAQIESDRNRFNADKSALKREKALLALSRKAVERSKKLALSRAGSEATLDTALQQEQQQLLSITQRQQSIDDFGARQKQFAARLAKAEAALKQANRNLARTLVKAPYSGRVTKVMVSVGDRIGNNTSLVELYDDTQLEIRTQVPSRYISALQGVMDSAAADAGLRSMTEHNGQRVGLRLHRLSASVNAGQGGMDVFFRTTRGTAMGSLPAVGSTVEVNLDLPPITGSVVLAPDAIYGSDRVYRIEDGVLRAIQVRRLGQQVDAEGRQALIVDGAVFSEGDLVLSSRLPQAIDGLKVATDEEQ